LSSLFTGWWRCFASEAAKLQTEGGKKVFSNYKGENNKMKMCVASPLKGVVEDQKGCTVHECKVTKVLK